MTSFEEALLKRLERIAEALEALVILNQSPEPASPPEPETVPTECQHPLKASLGITHGYADWECLECHYRPSV